MTSVKRPTYSSTGVSPSSSANGARSASVYAIDPAGSPGAHPRGSSTRWRRQCAAWSTCRGWKATGSNPFGTNTHRSGSRSSRSPARSTAVSERTITRSHDAAQPRSRSAHAAACGQRPGSASIASSISSSVPCRWPTTGTPGATRAAASWIGVRWCRWSTSASAAPADCRARHQATTWRSCSSSPSEAKMRSGAPGPVLVRRVHRRVRQHRVRRLERARHVERVDVERRSRTRARRPAHPVATASPTPPSRPSRSRQARSPGCAPHAPTRREGRRRAPSRPAAAVNDL